MKTDTAALQRAIEQSFESGSVDRDAVHEAMALLDQGRLRVAEKVDGTWVVHAWVKQAILLYFRIAPMRETHAGEQVWHDKIPLKTDLAAQGILNRRRGIKELLEVFFDQVRHFQWMIDRLCNPDRNTAQASACLWVKQIVRQQGVQI